jgi:hypothetical protein
VTIEIVQNHVTDVWCKETRASGELLVVRYYKNYVNIRENYRPRNYYFATIQEVGPG